MWIFIQLKKMKKLVIINDKKKKQRNVFEGFFYVYFFSFQIQ